MSRDRTLPARLLNAADRICEGLEPREHCADLLLAAHKELADRPHFDRRDWVVRPQPPELVEWQRRAAELGVKVHLAAPPGHPVWDRPVPPPTRLRPRWLAALYRVLDRFDRWLKVDEYTPGLEEWEDADAEWQREYEAWQREQESAP